MYPLPARQWTRKDAIYADFSKAFDLVSHKLLIFDLQALYLFYWRSSYLHNRSFKILFNPVTSGQFSMIQGNHLGPILHVLINQWSPFCDYVQPYLNLWADDVKLFSSSFTFELLSYLFQFHLDNLTTWCSKYLKMVETFILEDYIKNWKM